MIVEMLLTVHQIAIECPRVSTLYTDPESLLRYGTTEVLVNDATSLLPAPPSSVLIIDSSALLFPLSLQVIKMSNNYYLLGVHRSMLTTYNPIQLKQVVLASQL